MVLSTSMSLINKDQILKAFDATITVIASTLQIPEDQSQLTTDDIVTHCVDALYEFSKDDHSLARLSAVLQNMTKSLSGLIDMLDFAQIVVIEDPVPSKFYGLNPQVYINLVNSLRKDFTKDKVTSEDLRTVLGAIEKHVTKNSLTYRIHLIMLILELLRQYTAVAVMARLVESQVTMVLENM